MNGCIFKRTLPSGSITWGYSIDAGKDEKGKRKQIFKSGFALKGDAATALRKKLNEKDEGELVKPDPTSFAAFFQEWFKGTPTATARRRRSSDIASSLAMCCRTLETPSCRTYRPSRWSASSIGS